MIYNKAGQCYGRPMPSRSYRARYLYTKKFGHLSKLIILVLLFSIGACSTTDKKNNDWQKQGVSVEQKNRDISDCKASVSKLVEPETATDMKSSATVRKKVVHFGEFDNHIDDTRRNRKKIFDLCMEYLKYTKKELIN